MISFSLRKLIKELWEQCQTHTMLLDRLNNREQLVKAKKKKEPTFGRSRQEYLWTQLVSSTARERAKMEGPL